MLGACAGRTKENRPPRIDRTVISREQMLKGRFTSVYDAVAAMRSNWLRPRGPESFMLPLEVWVYLDDNRLGDVETLRTLNPSQVSTVRFYDGPSATSRWGVGHGAGVIHVSTWSDGALGFPRSGAVTGDFARWVATWSASPQRTDAPSLPPAPGLAHRTLRQIVHATLGGKQARVRVSNRFGDGPLTIEDVHLATAADSGAIRTLSDVAVTFRGQKGVTIAAGDVAVSDPIDYEVDALSNLAVTMRFGDVPNAITGHPGSRTTSYLQDGDWLSSRVASSPTTMEHWYVLTGVDVAVAGGGAAVVVLGNSITDGRGSATDKQNRWPDELARRLQDDRRTRDVAVINAGLGGNCVLRECVGPSALERLERDVLQQSGARWLIVTHGVNDLGTAAPTNAAAVGDSLVAAYRRIITAARKNGMRVYGATMMPFGGSQYDAPEREAARQRVNTWIRTSRAFDAVIDFDFEMKDARIASRLRQDVDGGDHLHPNERGYRLMAELLDLALFTR